MIYLSSFWDISTLWHPGKISGGEGKYRNKKAKKYKKHLILHCDMLLSTFHEKTILTYMFPYV